MHIKRLPSFKISLSIWGWGGLLLPPFDAFSHQTPVKTFGLTAIALKDTPPVSEAWRQECGTVDRAIVSLSLANPKTSTSDLQQILLAHLDSLVPFFPPRSGQFELLTGPLSAETSPSSDNFHSCLFI